MFNAPTSSVATPRPGTLPEAEVAEEGSREEPGLLGTWQGRRRMTVSVCESVEQAVVSGWTTLEE